MRGELELLQKSDTKDINTFIKSSLQEVDNLAGIVQEMLLLSRVDAGIGALNLQELSLDEVIFEALPRCERLAKSKDIKLKVDINNDSGDDRKMILGDNDLLQNLIFNIIENAIKYSPNNEIVTITLNWKKESSELVVEDRGPGIPSDQLPYIFDRFSRGSGIETRVKGFGLGLAIAQKIAILHDTKLIAAHRPGGGAQFSIEIKNI
jgi:signal transduction histidine kinase